MVDLADAPPAPVAPAPRRRRSVAIASVLAVAAGLIAAGGFVLHYRNAAALTNDGGGYGWMAPDNVAGNDLRIGSISGLVATARPGQQQSFFFDVTNNSSVTQTILGLDFPPREQVLWYEHVAVATTDDWRINEQTASYTEEPVALAPHTTRAVRLTIDTPPCPEVGLATSSWDGVELRVRVGVFTRTQTIKFSNVIFQLNPPHPACQ